MRRENNFKTFWKRGTGTKLFRLSLSLFAGSRKAVLGLHGRQLGLLLVRVQLLEGLVGLVVEDDEVPVADVEAAKMVASVLGVEDVLVDDEGGAAGLGCVANSNLPYCAVFSENVVHLLGRNLVRQVPDVQNSVHFWGKSNLQMKSKFTSTEADSLKNKAVALQ